MGYQFKKLSGIDPFVIDQNKTVNFSHDIFHANLVDDFRNELDERGGTAGFLNEEAPFVMGKDISSDASLISTQNDLE